MATSQINNSSNFIALLQGRLNVAANDRAHANKRVSERRAAKRQAEYDAQYDWRDDDDYDYGDDRSEDNRPADEPSWMHGTDEQYDAYVEEARANPQQANVDDHYNQWLATHTHLDQMPAEFTIGGPAIRGTFDTPEWLRNIHAEYVSDAELAETRARLDAEDSMNTEPDDSSDYGCSHRIEHITYSFCECSGQTDMDDNGACCVCGLTCIPF